MEYSNPTGLPSVSDIMEPFEDTRWFQKHHAFRGNFVHGWIGADLMGLMTPPVPEQFEGYIKSYLEFKPHIVKVILIEKRLSSERGYCGGLDLIAELDDVYNNCITYVDWKTSKAAYKSWEARSGGYFGLAIENGIPVKAGATVRLREKPTKTKGYFPLVNFYNEAEMRENHIDFLCALRTFNNVLNYGKIYASYEPIEREY